MAKNLVAPAVTRCYGQLSSCRISDKTNDPILRKLSDGRTEGQTDKSDSIGHCFFSILYLTSIEIIFTIHNLIYIVLTTFAIETN